MRHIALLTAAGLLLSGCLGLSAPATIALFGSTATATAAITNADVNAIKAYCNWRDCSSKTEKP